MLSFIVVSLNFLKHVGNINILSVKIMVNLLINEHVFTLDR